MMDLKDLQNLIRFVSKSDVAELKYKTREYELSIKTNNYFSFSRASSNQNCVNESLIFSKASSIETCSKDRVMEAAKVINDTDKYFTITSPMVGTFYQKSGPEQSFLVKEGDLIVPGQVLCIIEAMKLFNEIESEISGRIIKILVKDSTPVEYGQPLFLIDVK